MTYFWRHVFIWKKHLELGIGSTLGLLVAGAVLIFIFVGVLVGGLVGALADSDPMARAEVDLDDANILKVHY